MATGRRRGRTGRTGGSTALASAGRKHERRQRHAVSAAPSARPSPNSKPWWPTRQKPPAGAPNILVVLFDDVGFSDFGCYGSPIRTPTIDGSPAEGLRYTGFHTTAMCSTTRAALLTGRNHHSVGVGCLANFDSGYPGYRGKIAREAGTLAEMLRAHGYRNYMVGKWHVTPLTESGADRAVRRLAAGPRLRPLLRLHGRRDRPVRAGAGLRQHAHRSARHAMPTAIT